MNQWDLNVVQLILVVLSKFTHLFAGSTRPVWMDSLTQA